MQATANESQLPADHRNSSLPNNGLTDTRNPSSVFCSCASCVSPALMNVRIRVLVLPAKGSVGSDKYRSTSAASSRLKLHCSLYDCLEPASGKNVNIESVIYLLESFVNYEW